MEITFTLAFLKGFVMYSYVYVSTLTIFLAFMGYAKPLFFKTLLKTKNVILMFGFGYCWTMIAMFFRFPRFAFATVFGIEEGAPYAALMVFSVTSAVALYALMLASYVAVIVLVIKRAGAGNAGAQGNPHWNVLKSVLIYCSPPNVFVGFALSGYACDTILEVDGMETLPDDFCLGIDEWSEAFTNLRLFITAFTTILAFHDYRVAVRSGFLHIVLPIVKLLKIPNKWASLSKPSSKELFTRTAQFSGTQ
ncbi:hypothetical protein QR680_015604 [Steinernema hermaphroditum]|uniref:Uncharacterized protein n=1 Tax=Steinernema hermaphroditum TaxID=289476 RepID=A0AA39LKX2_9BILA|nr:hypothetical protein QR680_015604 [Steinernema hermaphroditum]